MRWSKAPVALLTALALVLMACGGADEEPDEPDAAEPEETEDADEDDAADDEDDADDADASADDADDTEDLSDLEPVNLRLSTIVGPTAGISLLMEWFNDELEARTDGKVTSDLSFGGSLLPGPDFLSGVVDGRAEGGLLVPAYFPTEMPLANLIMLPAQGHSQGARPRAMQYMLDNNEAVAAEIEAAGMYIVGMTPNSTQVSVVTERVETVEDYDGLRMRVPGIPGIGFEAIGVEPAFISAEEVYESLQRGIVDGVTFPWDTHWSQGTYEVGDYIVQDGIGESGMAMHAISLDVWESLDPRVQEIVGELQGEWYDKLEEILLEVDMEACDDYIENGNEIIIFSEEEQEKMFEATNEVMFNKWRDDAVAAGLEEDVVLSVWDEYEAKVLEFNETTEYVDATVACLERMG